MRVLYFTRDYTPHDYRFLTSLVESGQEVFFLRLERSGRQLEDRSLPPEVRQVCWNGGKASGPFRWRDLPARLLELKRLLAEIRPDVLHAGPLQTVGFLAALSSRSIPLVAMSWGSDLLKDADRSRAYRWITRYVLSRAAVLVGDCQAVRDKAASLGFPIARTFIFPWGIDLERFSPESIALTEGAAPSGEARPLPDAASTGDGLITDSLITDCSITDGALTDGSLTDDAPIADSAAFRARLGWEDAFVVLSLRSWEPVYGVDVMLRGFARAAQEAALQEEDLQEERRQEAARGLRLLLLGGGSQAGLVHQIIQEYGLQNQVFLGGQVNQANLPTMYRAADLYVSASHSDGSSVSLMEALGCGLPALVTDIPSNREWLADGAQGWLFPDGDDQAVARGILRAYRMAKEQPDRLSSIRQAARLRAEQRADWKKNFTVLLEAYQAALRLAGKEASHA